MPHFYLHLSNGSGDTPDEEGIDLPDLESARSAALAAIRSILKEELGQGELDLNGRIRIAGADGEIILDVPFTDAVDIRRKAGG